MQIMTRPGALDAGMRRRLAVLLTAGTALLAAAVLSPLRVGVVRGHSMMPTLTPGQPFVFTRTTRSEPPLQRGDVVVVRLGGQVCVKRVLARGGESFWALGTRFDTLEQCRLLQVNTPVTPWLRRFPVLEGRKVRVPPGHLFVIGDSNESEDSRRLGPVPVQRVMGRVLVPSRGNGGGSLTVWSELPPTPQELTRHHQANGA